MACFVTDCPRPNAPYSLYCRSHSIEIHQAHEDWRRELKEDTKQFFTQQRPLYETDDDWRAEAVAKAVLPRGVRLFGSETATRWRIRAKEGATRSYNRPIDGCDDGLLPIEYRLAHAELKEAINQVLKCLTHKQELVIRMRFGIMGYVGHIADDIEVSATEMTLDEIGDALDLSRERVRQIEAKSLRILRHWTRSKYLRPFLSETSRYYTPKNEYVSELKVREVSTDPQSAPAQPPLPPEVARLVENHQVPDAKSIWFLSWNGYSQPKGAKLKRRKIEWTLDDLVACDTGKIIGTYKHIELKDFQSADHHMLVWITEE